MKKIFKFLYYFLVIGWTIKSISAIFDKTLPFSEKTFYIYALLIIIFLQVAPKAYKIFKQKKYQKRYAALVEEITTDIENNFQPISVDIKLTSDEYAYFKIDNVDWQELRKEQKSISYTGLSKTVNLGAGLRFRLGGMAPIRHTKDALTVIEEGTLYLTNKNIFLVNSFATKKIPLDKVINTVPYSDAICLQRNTGKAVFLSMNVKNSIRFSLTLEKILTNK
ncbi:MAG: hypothetical protein ACRC4W_03120 [Treponemataceae bacterium]